MEGLSKMIAAQPHPGFWRAMLLTLAKNPISAFSVLCVACTAAWLGVMSWRLIAVLESPIWCSKAIMAEKVSPGSSYIGLTTCVELLKIQLEAVATGFHLALGSFSFSLIVLIVVVVAGAKASGKVAGMEFNVSRDAEAAADHVVEGAQEAAAEVKAP